MPLTVQHVKNPQQNKREDTDLYCNREKKNKNKNAYCGRLYIMVFCNGI